MTRFLFTLLFPLLLVACGDDTVVPDEASMQKIRMKAFNDSLVYTGKQQIKTGDLILRTGTDYASDQVKTFSKTDKTYSHGGIAVVEKDSIFIYHVEPDFHHEQDKVRKEPFEVFCDPAKNFGYGIARYKLSDAELSGFLSYLDDKYVKQIPFDISFKLNTDDSMYCSEMIRKGLALSTNNRINIKIERLDDKRKYKLIKQYFKLDEKAIASREIVLIDQLFLNPECQLLHQYVFKTP